MLDRQHNSRKRSAMALSVALSLFGLLLVVFGSVVMVPYKAREKFRVDTSRVYVNETLTLPPRVSKEYAFDSLVQNLSIIQINTNGTGIIRFKIVDIVANYTVVSWERIPANPVFWTPIDINTYCFVLDNPYNVTATHTIVIKEYYLKHVEEKDVTHYRSLLDLPYAYLGVGLVAFGIALDAVTVGYEEIQRYKKRFEQKHWKSPIKD